MSEEGQEVASSSRNRLPEELVVGVFPEGHFTNCLGKLVERVQSLRQDGRLSPAEASELVALMGGAVSEAHRFAASRTESTPQDTQPQTQQGGELRSVPDVRRLHAIDLVRCKACREPLTGIDGYISAMSCKNFQCEKHALVIRTRS